jgi:hypothetical protein
VTKRIVFDSNQVIIRTLDRFLSFTGCYRQIFSLFTFIHGTTDKNSTEDKRNFNLSIEDGRKEEKLKLLMD